ncbi:hypothetical protein ACIHFD_15665 [Nonomuraea sp. NPDC051941]|uniref:hypothetical protein n=1 Tax=Nonomuraea sp. NPDC051941 TaxID=3364373 RepID=UPI0037C8E22A
MSITLTDQDTLTLRTAAWGAVSLMSAAGAAGFPHKAAIEAAARIQKGEPSPTMAEMARKITEALDAA